MSTYTPDVWVVLEFTTTTNTFRKVFAGWYGGFTQGDSWKLNSGITKTRINDNVYEFDGHSGSTYCGHRNNYKMSGLMHNILGNWLTQAEDQGVTIRILDIDEIVVS